MLSWLERGILLQSHSLDDDSLTYKMEAGGNSQPDISHL